MTLYAFNPAGGAIRSTGCRRFLGSNLTRAETIRIPVLFLGQVYDTPKQSLPWYNTLVWTLFVTPVGFLALAIVGRRTGHPPVPEPAVRDPGGRALGFLLALRRTAAHARARRRSPVPAGVRLLAVLAGLGAAALVERFGRWGKAIVAAALVEGALSVALMMPVPLSYFSPLIGGLPGAAKLGMEPTYFWDGLTR